MSGSSRWVLPLLLILAVSACKRNEAPAEKASSDASARVASSPSAVASASSSAGTSPANSIVPPASASPKDQVHCKALGKQGLVAIGRLSDEEQLIEMSARDDAVLLFTFHAGLGRATLSRIRRDGAKLAVVARHSGVGEPKRPAWTHETAYFTRNRSLYRMPFGGEQSKELAKSFSNSVTTLNGYVYGVNCDGKEPVDRLSRVPVDGGEVETVIELARPSSKEQFGGTFACDYRSFVAGNEVVYASHWNGRRIVRFDLRARTAQVIVNQKTFPDNLFLERDGEHLVFQASDGVYRVPVRGGDSTRVTKNGAAPFSYLAFDGKQLYLHDGIANAVEEWTYVLNWPESELRKVQLYRDEHNVTEGIGWSGVSGISVDEECLYTARKKDDIINIYARAR